MLGLYDLYGRLTQRFPDILFESCASGGGRFDPGMLAFAPQAWTSDDTDAVERLRIQYGTSLVYPLSAMGAHVSAVPNHQVGRPDARSTRGPRWRSSAASATSSTRAALDDEDRARVRDQIAWYKAASRAAPAAAASIASSAPSRAMATRRPG